MRLKRFFFISLGIIILVFLFIERAILTPFIFAAIFAYLFNPIITFTSRKFKLPRTAVILCLYTIFLVVLGIIGAILSRQIAIESIDITKVTNTFFATSRAQIRTLPDWLRPLMFDLVIQLKNSRFVNLIQSPSAFFVVNQAISRIISFIIFLFSGFYFLKDGENFVKKLFSYIPQKYTGEINMLLSKINTILGGYLRGQVVLIMTMSFVHFIALSIIGVRFALTIAIFSGFAEIVPVIGPITAGSVAVLVILLTGSSNFGLQPMQAALLVAALYFIFRQLEDYLLIPHIMEQITKLPPFFIFFAVIAGGHIAGMLGLILAVPSAAIIKLLLEYSLEKVNKTS